MGQMECREGEGWVREGRVELCEVGVESRKTRGKLWRSR